MHECELVKGDVLIIGAGGAGLRAAIAAADNGANVMLVSKGPIGRSGITVVGMGGFSAHLKTPDDTPEIHFKEIVEGGKFLSDQNVVESLVSDGLDRILDLEKYGVEFRRDNSEYWRIPVPGTTVPRFLFLIGGGRKLMAALKKVAEQYNNIDMFEDIIISRLLVEDNHISGAIGLDARRGKIKVFQCKALVLAAGGGGYLWSHSDCPAESTGDAYALAYHAGEKLVNMEQQMFYPTVAIYPKEIRGQEQTYEISLRFNVGGQLLDNNDEVIYPVGEYRTRDSLTNLIMRTITEGRGTVHGGVYLDLTKVVEDKRNEVLATLLGKKLLDQFHIDLWSQRIEVAPAAHTTLGGVRIDDKGQTTNIGGFFACGEATGNVHGANRLAGHSFLDIQVFGALAGKYAAEFANGQEWVPLNEERMKNECNAILSYLAPRKDGLAPSKLKQKIKNLVGEYLGPIRNKKGLEKAAEEIGLMKTNDLPRINAPDIRQYNNDWIEAIEVRHMLDCAELVARCALSREESRGAHFREDFPYMDNEKPIQHTVVWLHGGQIKASRELVNMTKIKPAKEKVAPF